MPKTVVAYEDDATLRQQLESIFYAIRDDYTLVASFPNAIGVTAEITQLNPDIVLMDIQMLEDDDGLVALYQIKQSFPCTKVMMLTFMDADHKIFDAICLGADGYMLKSDLMSYQAPHEAMRRSLQVIFDGGAYMTPTVARQAMNLLTDRSLPERLRQVTNRFASLFRKGSGKSKARVAGLTPTQITVLRYIVEGLTTGQIAGRMNVTENTVNTHIKGIYIRLGVHSRALVVKKAIENRWFP